jgi:quercetin dioxygenase-like cupin family protein
MITFKYAEMTTFMPAPDTVRRQAYTDHIMMAIVDFTHGPSPAAPPHRHPHEQISYVVQGRIHLIQGEGENQTVTPLEEGDVFVVPPNEPHTVGVLTKTARLIDCFYPIREDFL